MTGYLKLSDFSPRGIQQLNNEITSQISNYIIENNISSGNVDVKELIDNLTINLDEATGKIYVDFSQLTSIDASIVDGLETFIQDRIDVIEFPSIEHNHDDSYSPIGHTHQLDDVTGITQAIYNVVNGMELNITPTNHTHPQSQITNLESDLASKSPLVHEHSITQVTNLTDELSEKLIKSDLDAYDVAIQSELTSIKTEIQALSRIGNFTTTLPIFADLGNVESAKENDLIIILDDEDKNSNNTIYIYNGTDWIFSGEISSDIELRDFNKDKIKLDLEVVGKLPLSNIADIVASDIKVTDTANHYVSEHIEGALGELGAEIKTLKSLGMEGQIIYLDEKSHLPATGDKVKLYVVLRDIHNSNNTSIYRYDGNSYQLLSNFNPASYAPLPYMQVTFSNIVASTNNPKVIELNIERDENQVRKMINVLAYQVGSQNQYKPTSVLNMQTDWDNEDYIEIDGTLHVRIGHVIDTYKDVNNMDGHSYVSSEVNVDDYTHIDRLRL